MIIRIDEYRKIRTKVYFADTLVHSLTREIGTAHELLQQKDSARYTLISANAAQAKTIHNQAETIGKINGYFDSLYKDTAKKKTPFFERPPVIFVGGFTLGITTVVLIKKALE